ncbi:hypothetical protein WJX74_000621 [Apatococcus lobatus]|uniref:Proline-rich protein PRCC n=1 Tax=Apatococcus lobatus TaxID=904363 RepID=A0AAW1RRY4_9CHLO
MDLIVGGYASGSDDSGEPSPRMQEAAPAAGRLEVHKPANAGLLSSLPVAREAKPGSRTSLPVPASKKPVLFRVPLDPALLAESDEDEDRPAKKVKVDKAKGLMASLPAPKHSMPAPKRDHFAHAQASKREAAGAQPAATPGAADVHGNEAFRIPTASHPEPPAFSAATPADQYHHQHVTQSHGSWQNGDVDGGTWPAEQAAGPLPPTWNGSGADAPHLEEAGPVLDPMQQAYIAENVRGTAGPGKDSVDPFASAGINFVEVKGQDLREGSRAARDAQQGMRSALGPDYEARLRREAGPKPDRKARGKHQISSLFHAAKMKELEQFEQRAQGMKTKAETQAKYGW